MDRTLAGRGALTVETNGEVGLIHIMQEDALGNSDGVSMGPHDVPQVIEWLREAAAELTGEAAATAAARAKLSLVGHGFHTFVACDVCGKRRVERQGEIIEQVGLNAYLVQLFSWLDGRATTQKVVTLEDMRDWDLYANAEEMNDYYASFLSKIHNKCVSQPLNGASPRPEQAPVLRLDDR